MNRLDNTYLPWLLSFVVDKDDTKRYSTLFNKLYSTPFEHRMLEEHDFDRSMDGKNMRWRFERKMEHALTGIPSTEFMIFEDSPCSLLEMIVALAIRMEESIASDDRQGDRTGIWFWEMITNLGLGYMSNDRFNAVEFNRCVGNFHNRTYDPDGKGCLFRSKTKSIYELAELDIWYQMCAHMNDTLEIK